MRRNILPGNGRFRIPEQFLLISLCISCVLSLYFYCHYLLVFIIKEIVNSVTKTLVDQSLHESHVGQFSFGQNPQEQQFFLMKPSLRNFFKVRYPVKTIEVRL